MEAGGSASRAEVAGRSVVVEHSGTASLEKNWRTHTNHSVRTIKMVPFVLFFKDRQLKTKSIEAKGYLPTSYRDKWLRPESTICQRSSSQTSHYHPTDRHIVLTSYPSSVTPLPNHCSHSSSSLEELLSKFSSSEESSSKGVCCPRMCWYVLPAAAWWALTSCNRLFSTQSRPSRSVSAEASVLPENVWKKENVLILFVCIYKYKYK